jgi:hypothetical protein
MVARESAGVYVSHNLGRSVRLFESRSFANTALSVGLDITIFGLAHRWAIKRLY